MPRLFPEKRIARNHLEAYDLWATHFDDPALMANRDAKTTRLKLERLVARLPLEASSIVLDVGPGDGTFFRIVAGRVARCCGVDPSPRAVARLRRLFEGSANVEFEVGASERIPHPDATFDVVVINSVLQMLASEREIEVALRELVRVCRAGGVIFVGELPFRSELGKGIARHVLRKLREYGLATWLRLSYHVYLRPLLRGEPLVLYPASNLHVPAADFEALCERLGLALETSRHREPKRESETRNDYLLRVPPRPADRLTA